MTLNNGEDIRATSMSEYSEKYRYRGRISLSDTLFSIKENPNLADPVMTTSSSITTMPNRSESVVAM